MEKHPSSLAAYKPSSASGNVLRLWRKHFQMAPVVLRCFWWKTEEIRHDLTYTSGFKNIISSTRCFICTEVLPFLIFADIKYFHQGPCLHESSAILPMEAYFT